jgi:hypothetical protein
MRRCGRKEEHGDNEESEPRATLYQWADLMKAPDTRALVKLAAGMVTIIETCNLADPPGGKGQ